MKTLEAFLVEGSEDTHFNTLRTQSAERLSRSAQKLRGVCTTANAKLRSLASAKTQDDCRRVFVNPFAEIAKVLEAQAALAVELEKVVGLSLNGSPRRKD